MMTYQKWPYTVGEKSRRILDYAAVMARNLGGCFPGETEKHLNKSLIGYPRNHTYKLRQRAVLPTFRLYDRLKTVAAIYPKAMESFMDLGCCRGYFVLDAAGRPGCRVATGIDVHEPFVSTANRVFDYLKIRNAKCYVSNLDAVSREPKSFGGPFQVVLMLGTYHYFYWGSERYPSAYRDHREILLRLSRICAGKLILSGRLEISRLPRALKNMVAADKASVYTLSHFLDAAAEFFEVQEAGHIGRDPLLLMSKRVM